MSRPSCYSNLDREYYNGPPALICSHWLCPRRTCVYWGRYSDSNSQVFVPMPKESWNECEYYTEKEDKC